MTITHLFIAWTLFGVLLVWIVVFAFLALRPEAQKRLVKRAETPFSTTVAPSMARASLAQSHTSSSVNTQVREQASNVEVASLV